MKNDMAFAFDLHGVLVKRDYPRMALEVLKHLYRLDLIVPMLNPFFIRDFIKLCLRSRVPEEVITTLAEKYPKIAGWNPIIIKIVNKQKPIESTYQLVDELKQKGYPVYLFSNIGEQTFADLKEKEPELFTPFDAILITEPDDNWIQKPQIAAFEKFCKTLGIKPENCVFVDNSKTNIKSARSHGFHTIYYRSPKSLEHIKKAI